MNKTILIVLGLACALITAAGIMFNPVSVARRQLYDKDPDVRCHAIRSLCKDKASFPRMRSLLYDEDIIVAINAATFLYMSGDKESIPDYRNLLNNKEPVIREAAIFALWLLGDKESIPEFKKLLNDEDIKVSDTAELALEKLGVPEAEIEEAKENK